jgi:hypothetical protein
VFERDHKENGSVLVHGVVVYFQYPRRRQAGMRWILAVAAVLFVAGEGRAEQPQIPRTELAIHYRQGKAWTNLRIAGRDVASDRRCQLGPRSNPSHPRPWWLGGLLWPHCRYEPRSGSQ